ncbi:MAG: hypothetical protein IJZ85_05745 [Lachnospiraceae bacterium]|nr:hypothetical protein [Lachnospiraceae bacterium]
MKRTISLILILVMLLPLLTACGSSEVTYKSLIVKSSAFDLDSGTFTETESSCVFVVENVDRSKANRYLEQELLQNSKKKGFDFYEIDSMTVQLEMDDADGQTRLHYAIDSDSNTFTWLRYTYWNGTLLIAIGEQIPDESACWALAGLSEELIPIPMKDNSLITCMPFCASITTDNTGSIYGTLLEDGVRAFDMVNLTMELVNDYIQAAIGMGYVEESRGSHKDTSVETLRFQGRRADNITIDVYYCEGDGYVRVSNSGAYIDPNLGWQRVGGIYLNEAPELTLNDMYHAGLNYALLDPHILVVDFGARLNRGNGYNSLGIRYYHAVECTVDDFYRYVSDMEAQGFTMEVEETVDGDIYLHTACKQCDYNGETYYVWETIRLNGDYFFAAVSLAPLEVENYPIDPRLQ